jgi:EAL domain-containing protein (putative c-di-GMP-specific phosphodiesterase class I)
MGMDGAGTGHSPLSTLSRLPLSRLMIGRSLVERIGLHAADAALVRALIATGRALGLEVMAEGVQTQVQRAFLAQHGCTMYQGDLFGRPVPLADFEAMLAADGPA